MDEQVIDDLYNRAKSKGYSKSKDEFIQLLHTDNEVLDDSYSYVKSMGYPKQISNFKTLIGFGSTTETSNDLKKKEDTQSLASDQTTVPTTDQTAVASTESPTEGTPLASPSQPTAPIIQGSPGLTAPLAASQASVVQPTEAAQPETTQASTTKQTAQASLPQAGAEAPIAIATPKVAEVTPIVVEKPKETPYFTGTVGAILETIDAQNPLFKLGDFIDDIGRAVDAGSKTAAAVTPGNKVLIQGRHADSALIKQLINASNEMNKLHRHGRWFL